jgi:hypothetical protein
MKTYLAVLRVLDACDEELDRVFLRDTVVLLWSRRGLFRGN